MSLSSNDSSDSSSKKLVLEHLVQKYDVAVPRYTSYPTAVEFGDTVDASSWVEALGIDGSQSQNTLPLALYLHVPFCKTLCYFCACNKIISRDRNGVEAYLNAVINELSLYREILPAAKELEQIHWGGGTPNYLTVEEIEQLFFACTEGFSQLASGAEVSVEVDPRTVSADQISRFCQLGFNRASLGVQDFSPEVQQIINRVQSFDDTRIVCDRFRQAGVSEINIDLVYGLPEQTEGRFAGTMEQVLKIRPSRLALYGYAHVTWIKKVQKALERAYMPSPMERLELLLMARKTLLDAGYVALGIDHFALPEDSLAQAHAQGTLNRNFMGYTTKRGLQLLGVGVSAISSFPRAFAQNYKEISQYLDSLAAGELPVERGVRLSADDRIRGFAISDLLCKGEINYRTFELSSGVEFKQYFAESMDELARAAEDGLLQQTTGGLVLTELGQLFGRNLASIFDAYLPGHRESGKRTFSQAV